MPAHCVLGPQALHDLLADDRPHGDLSTEALGLNGRPARIVFRARQDMRVCGLEEARALFKMCGLDAHLRAASGDQVSAQATLLEAEGEATAIFGVWKVAQTLVEWASGIATAAAGIVAAAQAVRPGLPVACTRKNVPGTKALSVKAVRSGGARMHRLGLSETLLVFPEHQAFLQEEPASTVARLRTIEPEKSIVVELTSHEAALAWASAGVDVLQLEKFSPQAVEALGRELGSRPASSWGRPGHPPVLAVAGGVRADNAADYARAGAGLLITSAPYTAPPCDVAVRLEPVGPV